MVAAASAISEPRQSQRWRGLAERVFTSLVCWSRLLQNAPLGREPRRDQSNELMISQFDNGYGLFDPPRSCIAGGQARIESIAPARRNVSTILRQSSLVFRLGRLAIGWVD
jgi:hypothetical protein